MTDYAGHVRLAADRYDAEEFFMDSSLCLTACIRGGHGRCCAKLIAYNTRHSSEPRILSVPPNNHQWPPKQCNAKQYHVSGPFLQTP